MVEDKYLTATRLTMALEEAGACVVGPVSHVEGALELLEAKTDEICAALLDIDLNDSTVFELADQRAKNETPSHHRDMLPRERTTDSIADREFS